MEQPPVFAIRILCAALALAAGAATAHAAISVDEATYPGAAGDYNNLLNPPRPEAVVFAPGTGTSLFRGTIGTPSDAGDTFIIALGEFDLLTRIRLIFATNATDFNPVAVTQKTELFFDRSDSNASQPLVLLAVPDRQGFYSGPTTFESPLLALGTALYGTTISSGLLALNDNNGVVGYRVEFDVTSTAPVPEPSSYALLLGGLGLLGWAARRRQGALRSA
jgi:hypothetical protein